MSFSISNSENGANSDWVAVYAACSHGIHLFLNQAPAQHLFWKPAPVKNLWSVTVSVVSSSSKNIHTKDLLKEHVSNVLYNNI